MSESSALARVVDDVLARHRGDPTRLVQMLREIEDDCAFVPAEALTRIAAAIGVPRARVEGVAGFYSFLHTEPAGRYRVLFSDNITDRMQGSVRLLDHFCRKLWLERGRLSEDGLVNVDLTSCTGMCDQGPALLVNGWAIPRLTEQRLDAIVDLIRAQVPLGDWPHEFFEVADNVRRKDLLLDNAIQPGDAIRAAIARGPRAGFETASNERSWREAVLAAPQGPVATLEEIKRSNLRGRGGAGFSTGLKWEACRSALGQMRYVVCNADEGEPGTFKDRVLLARCADLVVEGMTVCAYVIGAGRGFIYLRGEYRHLYAPLRETLERRRRAYLLGGGILGQPGFDFDIEIHLGAGAYVCGEESALIESLEGRRGVPRNRPPYPVTHGYLQQPTAVNNVETFCAAALIAIHGGDWYRSVGTPKSAGTKLLSVSGDCERPGLYEFPFGVSVREVLDDCGAADTQAVQVSGPSGVCLDATEFRRRIAFEDVPTAGSFMVFGRQRDMFEVARNFSHFFAHESCGFCTPCRVGTTLLKNCMDKLHAGQGTQHDLSEIADVARVLQTSSHCGLGHTACNPLFDTLKKFRPSYERRLGSLAFAPGFDLDGALAAARQMTGRDDPFAHLQAEPRPESPERVAP